MAGLTATGFEIKRLTDIIDEMRLDAQNRYGTDINTDDDSILGMLIDIIAQQVATEWELAEAVYAAYIPASAEGVQLDNIASINGVFRQIAAPSEAAVTFYGDLNSVIPVGTIVADPVSHNEFATTIASSLDPSTAANYIEVYFPSVATANETYVITIAGEAVSINNMSNTPQAVTNFVNDINGNATLAALCNAVAYDADETVRITSVTDTEVGINTFTSSLSTNLGYFRVGVPVNCAATVNGAIVETAGDIIDVVTNLNGIDSACYNYHDANLGRQNETDTELRLRRLQSVTTSGAGTVDAITSDLLNIPNVSYALVTENDTDATVDSIPAHAFQAVVSGGDTTEIGQVIWDAKPAGIQAYGTIDVPVVDFLGNSQVVSFSRPTEVAITVTVAYTLYDEESFPPDGNAAIEAAIVQYGNALGIGTDVIAQRFFGPIFLKVAGIENLIITVDSSISPSTDSGKTVDISPTQFSFFETANITVTGP